MDTTLPKKKFAGISGSTLKLIAITTMLIDHIGASIVEGYIQNVVLPASTGAGDSTSAVALQFKLLLLDSVLRGIGRIAFPIFCFLLVQGFMYTHDRWRYASRLLLFAFISEVPFDLAFTNKVLEFTHQNVYFTLFLGLVTIWLLNLTETKLGNKIALRSLLFLVIMGAGMGIAYLLRTDYSFVGILVIMLFYVLQQRKVLSTIAGTICLALSYSTEFPCLLAIIPVYFYNGKRGLSLKYIFYIFYPAHLLILFVVCKLMGIY